jgi:hypothetical protein
MSSLVWVRDWGRGIAGAESGSAGEAEQGPRPGPGDEMAVARDAFDVASRCPVGLATAVAGIGHETSVPRRPSCQVIAADLGLVMVVRSIRVVWVSSQLITCALGKKNRPPSLRGPVISPGLADAS